MKQTIDTIKKECRISDRDIAMIAPYAAALSMTAPDAHAIHTHFDRLAKPREAIRRKTRSDKKYVESTFMADGLTKLEAARRVALVINTTMDNFQEVMLIIAELHDSRKQALYNEEFIRQLGRTEHGIFG